MDSLETLERFLGWCAVINLGLLSFSAIGVVLFRGWFTKIHGKMFGLGGEDLSRAYFQFLAQYEIAIFLLNVAPYLALKVGF